MAAAGGAGGTDREDGSYVTDVDASFPDTRILCPRVDVCV